MICLFNRLFFICCRKKVDILLWLNLFFWWGGASSVLNLLFILRAPLISLQFSIEFLEKYCSLTFLSIYRSCITTSTDTERISKLRGVSTKICRLRSEATRQEKSSQNCMVWPSIFSFKSSICSKKSFVWFTISLQGCLFHKIGL